jgi:ParB-like chromosome segregation protein Spo0J
MMFQSRISFAIKDKDCGYGAGFAILHAMEIKTVGLNGISLEDEGFRISEELDCQRLEDSLAEIGQLNPVNLLAGESSAMIIICGFRRLRALNRLGVDEVLARLWSPRECPPLRVLKMVLWDNLSHRQLHPLEIARVLVKLRETAEVRDETLLRVYLPIVGLPPHRRILQDYLNLHSITPGLRRLLLEERTTVRNALVLAGEEKTFQLAMADLLNRVHLSASRQREVIELVRDLAAMREQKPEEVLDDPDILAACSDGGASSAQKGEAVHRYLRRERCPRYTQAMEGFESEKGKLGLPQSIRISPDPYFETSGLHIDFDARSAQEYREIVSALSKASESSGLENLFRINE